MDGFAGKVALVTGAGRGIGRKIALGLAASGAVVAVNDINPLNLDDTVNQVVQAGGTARAYVFDIAKRMPVEGMVAQVLEHFGRIDMLVNHASVQPDAAVLEMDEWEFHRTLEVNLGGAFFTMQLVGRVMQQHGGGAIVNLISSGGEQRFHKGHAAYSASLAALVGLTVAAAGELAAYHIQVNAVCHGMPVPGQSFTNGTSLPGWREWSESQLQAKTRDEPELVSAVLYLCSPQAASLTGKIVSVDCSASARNRGVDGRIR